MKQKTLRKKIIKELEGYLPGRTESGVLEVYQSLRKLFGKMLLPEEPKKESATTPAVPDLKSYEQEALSKALPILWRIRNDEDVSGVMATADSSKFVTATNDFLWFIETRTKI